MMYTYNLVYVLQCKLKDSTLNSMLTLYNKSQTIHFKLLFIASYTFLTSAFKIITVITTMTFYFKLMQYKIKHIFCITYTAYMTIQIRTIKIPTIQILKKKFLTISQKGINI